MRRVKTGDYEHAEMKAEINFSVPEGEDGQPVFDRATSMAVSKVLEVLGLKKPEPAKVAPQHTPNQLASQTTLEAAYQPLPAAPERRKPGRPPGSRVKAEDRTGDPTGGAASASLTGEDTTAAEPDSFLAEMGGGVPEVKTEVIIPQEDPADFMQADFSAPPQTYSDTDLNKECGEKAKELKDTAAIRALIAVYVAPGKALRDIPQEKRGEFLAKLKGLK
jgi:hypothetical protein